MVLQLKNPLNTRVANPFKKDPDIPFGKWYVNGNFVDGSTEVTNNNWKGVVMDKGTGADAEKAKLASPFPSVDINTQPAFDAYTSVLQHAGCSFPNRDTLDIRIINDVKNRTGKFIDVQGGYPHGTAYPLTVNAWPALKSLPAPKDSDNDGMPDHYETANKLDMNNSSDAAAFTLSKNYSNIEVYLNSLVKF